MSADFRRGDVFGLLGLVDDPAKGILVVGLDAPNLVPAVGAAATLDVEHGEAFVFGGQLPTPGQAIPAGEQGFVTFPNVSPGWVTIDTTFPTGDCRSFPSETENNQVQVIAGEVAVVAFTCRSAP